MSYNKQWIDALNVKSIASRLKNFNLINEEQLLSINEKFPEKFYTPNLFVRIGLFIFTLILANAGLGIFGMAIGTAFSNQMAFGVLCLIASGGLLFFLNLFIKSKNHFCSGIDDCLLYMAVFFAIFGLALITNFESTKLIILLAIPILVTGSVIYMDRLLAVTAFAALLALVFLVASEIAIGRALLPFIYLIISAVVVVGTNRFLNNDRFVYWEKVLKAMKVVGLFVVYLSMNYFVVRESNSMLNQTMLSTPTTPEYVALQKQIDENQTILNESYSDTTKVLSETEQTRISDENSRLYSKMYEIEQQQLDDIRARNIPMAWLFILFTMLLPVVYLYYGLHKKDRMVLLTGMIILAFTVFTYKYYNQLYPLEYTITFAGLLMIVFSWMIINYLKKKPGKFTFETDTENDNQGMLNAEAFVISQTVAPSGPAPQNDQNFGGGSFGGGGAGGTL